MKWHLLMTAILAAIMLVTFACGERASTDDGDDDAEDASDYDDDDTGDDDDDTGDDDLDDDDDDDADDDDLDDDVADDDEEVWADPVSELMWQNSGRNNGFGSVNAIEYCEDLSWSGYSDWRLPTISELRSLIRGCFKTVTGGFCGVVDNCLSPDICFNDPCNGCAFQEGPGLDGYYWPVGLVGDGWWYYSSSLAEGDGWGGIDDIPWGVEFTSGSVLSFGQGSLDGSMRCVRQ